jgi:hypothetical protein
MARIDRQRVLLGGLAAGLIMNVSEFVLHALVLAGDSQQLTDDWARRGVAMNQDASALLELVAMTFGLGLLAVWLYAAIRPRYGAGPRTALRAGLAAWAFSYLYAGVYAWAGIAVVPPVLSWLPVVWGLVEIPLATLVGAWVYQEAAIEHPR